MWLSSPNDAESVAESMNIVVNLPFITLVKMNGTDSATSLKSCFILHLLIFLI